MTWWIAKPGVTEKEHEKYKPKSLKYNLANLTCLERFKKGKPIIVFIDSKENVKRGKTTKATRQYLASFKAFNTVFYDKHKKGQILAGMYTCLKMDVTQIKEKDNKYVCSANAPIIALYNAEGELKEVYSGRNAANAPNVHKGLISVLKETGVDAGKMVKGMSTELSKLYRHELNVYKAFASFSAEKSKYSKMKRKNTAAEARVKRAEKKYTDMKAVSTGIITKCKNLKEGLTPTK
jgi:hypothetical protein